LESLCARSVLAFPEGIVLLIHGLTLVGILWLGTQGAALWRECRLVERVRRLFEGERLRDASACNIADCWATAGGSLLPDGWATAHVGRLLQMKDAPQVGVEALRRLAQRRAQRMLVVPRWLLGFLTLLAIAGTVQGLSAAASGLTPLLQSARSLDQLRSFSPPLPILLAGARSAGACASMGLLSALWLALLIWTFSQFQKEVLLRLETLSLTVLEPRILPVAQPAAAQAAARRWEESSRRFENAAQPFAAGLERLTEELRASMGGFCHRLDNSSHNVLQAVEGMREAASELCQGTAGLDLCYARLEAMYQRFEPLAAQVAGSQAHQQEQLTEIAGGLHGITASLTTVVASANESQAAVSGVATGIAEAVLTLQKAAAGLDAAVDRVVAALECGPHADRVSTAGEASLLEGVSLRCVVEQQQQFINVLDHRLASLDRYSSSSSSSSSSRSSSSSSSSSTPIVPPPRTLSNQAI
jgi:hypothetical protein